MKLWGSLPVAIAALAFLVSFAGTAQRYPTAGQDPRIDAATQAIQTDPGDSDVYVKRAVYYLEPRPDGGRPALHNMELAVEDLSTAIELNPRSYLAWHNYAHAAYLLGYRDLALVEFTRTIALNPSSARSFLGRGWTYFEFCMLDDATADFTRALRLDPSLRAKAASRQDVARRKNACADLLRIYGCKGVPLRKDGSHGTSSCGVLPYAAAHPPLPPPGMANLHHLYKRQEAYGRVNQAAGRGDHAARFMLEGLRWESGHSTRR